MNLWPRRRDAAPEAPRLDPELARALLAEVDGPQPFPGVQGVKTTVFAQQACQHCGGVHSRKCPAVAEVEFHADGKVKRVAYFPHGQWPADDVLWLEDVQTAAAIDTDEEVHGDR